MKTRFSREKLKRTLYFLLKRPTYPTEQMTSEDFEHLNGMFERQAIAGTLIKEMGSKKVLDIGSGFQPIYKYIDTEDYEMITCIDPVLKTERLARNVECFGMGIENLDSNHSYDTVVLLGLGHTMGKRAYEKVDTILEGSNVRCFILEHFVCRLLNIYVGRITKPLPKLGYKKKIHFLIEYPNNPLYDKREMEIWIR